MKKILIALALMPVVIQTGTPLVCQNTTPKISMRDAKCLATAIYGEARGESEQGQIAVAYTVMNRAVKTPVCKVVLAPKQYSVFNNNPALRAAATSLHVEPKQKNVIDNASWARAMKVATAVLAKMVVDPTNGATHYIADKVMHTKGYHYPKWTRQYRMVAVIENHKFYKV